VFEVGVVVGEALGQGEVRQQRFAELDLDVAAFGDPQRVVAGDLDVAEQRAHLTCRLEVVLVAGELEAVGVAHQRPRLHAQQRVVGLMVVLVGVVAVVGGEQRRPDAPGDVHQLGIGAALLGDAVILDLDEQVVSPEDVLQPRRLLDGVTLVAPHQRLQHVPTETPGGGDHAFAVILEHFPVAVVDGEVGYVGVILGDLDVVDEPVVVLGDHLGDRPVDVVVVCEGAPVRQGGSRRVVRAVPIGVVRVGELAALDRGEVVVERCPQHPHLPCQTLRGLGEDGAVVVMGTVAVEDPLEHCPLERLGSVPHERRDDLGAGAGATQALQQLGQQRRRRPDVEPAVVLTVGTSRDGRRRAGQAANHLGATIGQVALVEMRRPADLVGGGVALGDVEAEEPSEVLVELDGLGQLREVAGGADRALLGDALPDVGATLGSRPAEVRCHVDLGDRLVGGDLRQARPGSPVVHAVAAPRAPRFEIAGLDPSAIPGAVTDEHWMLARHPRDSRVLVVQHHAVDLAPVMAPHGLEHRPEAALVREDEVADLELLDALHPVGGDDLLARTQTARLVVVALHVGAGGDLDEVLVADVVLGQQDEVVVELRSPVDLAAGVVDPAAPRRPLVT
jgi:hypothetical protein